MVDHRRFVEVFGGGAAVLIQKEPSEVEVYNDIDGDLVNFFLVLRDQKEELLEFLDKTPFSHDLHRSLAYKYYMTDRKPDDRVRWAGEFFFLRYSQWMGNHGDATEFQHFGGEKAQVFRKAVESLEHFSDRFQNVTVEDLDYRDLLDEYDAHNEDWDGTLFYFDPLLLDGSTDDKFSSGNWDPDAFIERVNKIEGHWQVSCLEDEIPEVWLEDEDVHYVTREYKQYQECVVMNYDPDHVPLHSEDSENVLEF